MVNYTVVGGGFKVGRGREREQANSKRSKEKGEMHRKENKKG